MATKRQEKSFNKLVADGIVRYRGNRNSKDDIIVVIGPIVKLRHPDDRKLDYVGQYGMYWIRCYRMARGDWVLGKFDKSCWWPIDADKMVRQAKKFAKVLYYIPYGTLNKNGKTVRRDYELRPPPR